MKHLTKEEGETLRATGRVEAANGYDYTLTERGAWCLHLTRHAEATFLAACEHDWSDIVDPHESISRHETAAHAIRWAVTGGSEAE